LRKLWEADPAVAEYMNSIHGMENGTKITSLEHTEAQSDSES
jgi:hypothetical protein